MTARHANVAVFVPHMGCPHRCSFCSQNSITGQTVPPTADTVRAAAETAKQSLGAKTSEAEIAFFGGSFTAIEPGFMKELLKAAYPYVASGEFRGIRVSTRPDALDTRMLRLLKFYGVTSVELGAQSMDDRVLRLNRRGHTAACVREASRLIRLEGLELGLQMMTGLYGDSDEGAIKTAGALAALRPDTVRIYPTVVFQHTPLAKLYENGLYRPQELDGAVSLCSRLLLLFHEALIRVIRLGLHTLDKDAVLAGPWHPAFRELCEGKIYLEKALTALLGQGEKGAYQLSIPPKAVSKMAGQHQSNLRTLREHGYFCKIREDGALDDYQVTARRM